MTGEGISEIIINCPKPFGGIACRINKMSLGENGSFAGALSTVI